MVPLFTIEEAAGFLRVPTSTFYSWARPPDGQRSGRRALVTSFPATSRQAKVPFIGLAEGMVLSAFRRAGVPMQRIRPALLRLDREMGLEHALASKRMYTDGAEVLFDYPGAGELLGNLVVVRSGQRIFTKIVQQYLRQITYATDGWARLLRLPGYEHASVVVDPYRAFGRPLLERGGARLEDIIDRFAAGDKLTALASDFGVPPDELEDVIRAAIRPAA